MTENVSDEQPKSPYIELPERYQRKALNEKKLMARPDFTFLQGVERDYEAQTDQEADSGREAFFEAAGHVVDYAMGLRSTLDRYVTKTAERRSPMINHELFLLKEQNRPSSSRIQELSYLFLHLPNFRKEFLHIHADKLTNAFPLFLDSSQDVPSYINTTDRYFRLVQNRMAQALRTSLKPDDMKGATNVGKLMIYETQGYLATDHDARKGFAATGAETFTTFLKTIVDDAIDQGDPLEERIRKDFLDKEGLAYRAMRMDQHDFMTMIHPDGEPVSVEATQAILEEGDYLRGLCPAALGGTGDRPIAYEYAHVIVDRMPEHLKHAA